MRHIRLRCRSAADSNRVEAIDAERAGAVPLSVNMTISDLTSNVDLLEPLLPHTSKIGCLCLTKHRSIEGVTDNLPDLVERSRRT